MSRAGDGYISNRSLIQPPEPYENSTRSDRDTFSDETKELISVLKKTNLWTYDSSNNEHPLFAYLKQMMRRNMVGSGNYCQNIMMKMINKQNCAVTNE